MSTNWTNKKKWISFFRNIQPTKTESRRKRWFNQTDHWKWKRIYNNNFKMSSKQKCRTKWFHWRILPKLQRRIYTDPSQTLPKDWRGTLPKTFYVAIIILIPKPNKKHTKSYRPVSLINSIVQSLSCVQLCDCMDCSMPGSFLPPRICSHSCLSSQ